CASTKAPRKSSATSLRAPCWNNSVSQSFVSRSLSDLAIVGCESTAAVHFSPSFYPIAGLWGCKSGKNCPRWGRFSLSTLQARQTPRREAYDQCCSTARRSNNDTDGLEME